MKAIVFDQAGAEDVLVLREVDAPPLGAGEIRIRVAATAVNRADLLQRRGLHLPPTGVSPVLGLECAGSVMEVGEGVDGFRVGDRAMALLAGGGYAEQVVVDARHAMLVPECLSMDEAGALPEAFLTVFLNLFMLGGVMAGDTVLVHGGSSGVGTAALVMLREAGVRCLVTAGSELKCERCRALGAALAINYRRDSFREVVHRETGGNGIDAILDCVGGAYLADNLASLRTGGKLVLIGLVGGSRAELDLALLLTRRLQVIGSTLRPRSATEKATIVTAFTERFGVALDTGRLHPIIDRVYPLAQAAEAHRLVQSSAHIGKVVLQV